MSSTQNPVTSNITDANRTPWRRSDTAWAATDTKNANNTRRGTEKNNNKKYAYASLR